MWSWFMAGKNKLFAINKKSKKSKEEKNVLLDILLGSDCPVSYCSFFAAVSMQLNNWQRLVHYACWHYVHFSGICLFILGAKIHFGVSI